MGMKLEQRERILIVARIFQEETDSRHPIRLEDLTARLARMGLPTERKTIYRDINALRNNGMEIVFRGGLEGGWYLENRPLSLEDLRLLQDALAVYRWLPEDQRQPLAEKITALAPAPSRKSLERPVSVCTHRAASPDELRGILDRIHTCLQNGKAMTFRSVEYDMDREPVLGERKIITPKGMLWAGENYRLLAWDHKAQAMGLFRPDRMGEVNVTGMPGQGPDADPALWAALPFGPEQDRRERVRLRCRKEMVGEVMDQLGTQLRFVADGDWFIVLADVAVSPAFWSWAAAQEGQIEVTAPPWAAKTWQERYQPAKSCPRAV